MPKAKKATTLIFYWLLIITYYKYILLTGKYIADVNSILSFLKGLPLIRGIREQYKRSRKLR